MANTRYICSRNNVNFFSLRDLNTKLSVSSTSLVDYIHDTLNEIQSNLYNQADKFQQENTFTADSYDEFKKIIDMGGFVRCGWDGTADTEKQIKDDTKATIRCIPFNDRIVQIDTAHPCPQRHHRCSEII